MLPDGIGAVWLHMYLRTQWKAKREEFAKIPIAERVEAIVWKGAYGPDEDSTTRCAMLHGRPNAAGVQGP